MEWNVCTFLCMHVMYVCMHARTCMYVVCIYVCSTYTGKALRLDSPHGVSHGRHGARAGADAGSSSREHQATSDGCMMEISGSSASQGQVRGSKVKFCMRPKRASRRSKQPHKLASYLLRTDRLQLYGVR